MSGVTAEIAADFIVEAQEILDRLGEQLVALEHARDLQLRKGFQLMFVQGADAPR